jgi:predicted SAM-dependent methyltransferase
MMNHLALDEFRKAMANTRRMLQEGGIFRCVVPDMAWIAREFLRRVESGGHGASAYLMDATDLGKRVRPHGLHAIIHQCLRTSEAQWMWDRLSLTHELEEQGFRQIRPCASGDCEDPMFALVEQDRSYINAVALEARR